MRVTFDKNTDLWVATNGVITVRGYKRGPVEERFAELLSRYRSIQSLREPQQEDLL